MIKLRKYLTLYIGNRILGIESDFSFSINRYNGMMCYIAVEFYKFPEATELKQRNGKSQVFIYLNHILY